MKAFSVCVCEGVRKYGCVESQDSIFSIVTKIQTGRSGLGFLVGTRNSSIL